MESEQGKVFIGGISWETDENKLQEYFSFYGDVLQTVVMRDKLTGKPRGFGFVVFSDPTLLDKVLSDQHLIDGRTVEAKRALSRDEQQTTTRTGNGGNARNFGNGENIRTKKIFVGGLPATITEDGFRQYFEAYGTVTDVVVMFDQQTQRPRGFGFISFDSEDAVDRVLHKTFHDLNGKQVEVKRALPKDGNSGGGGGGGGRFMGGSGAGGGSGGYQGYGAGGGGSGSYADTNRYTQSQNTGGGYQGYGSSGYGASGYGYGPGSNAGYGAYGGYGGVNSGYGAPTGAAYGNPNVPSGNYGGGPQGGARGSGYGAVGYGNAAATWGGPGGGGGGAASGQSPGGGVYGYGGMDGSYANHGPYGAVGGRSGSVPSSNVPAGGVDVTGGSGGGYMSGGGYGDSNGNPGYGSQGWRADPSQAASNYGGGYGGGYGAPARQ